MKRKEYRYVANQDGSKPLSHDFHVRVLIPCYRESLEIVKATAEAALAAPLPMGCRKTVYILGDRLRKSCVKQFCIPQLRVLPVHMLKILSMVC